MKESEAMAKLAEAMSKLADNLERFQDPVIWQKVLSDTIHAVPGLATTISPMPVPGAARLTRGEPTPLPLHEELGVNLSDEERTKLVGQIHKAIEPQLAEFSEFVRQSLQEMPAHRLKHIGERMAAGEELKIKRKSGCIFISTGEDDTYLAL